MVSLTSLIASPGTNLASPVKIVSRRPGRKPTRLVRKMSIGKSASRK
jgi:hypothetical protein